MGADRINITNDATVSGDIILNRNTTAGRLLRFTELSTANNALFGQNNTSGFNGLSIRMNNSTSMSTGTQVMGWWNDGTGIVMGPQTTRIPSAQLDMQSTTQGFAPPRMTTTQRNAITSGIYNNGTIAGGTGYTNGTYTANALTGGSGAGATATITVAGGIVTIVTIVAQGSGYAIGNVLSTSGIGAGSGFTYTITTLTGAEGLVVYDMTLHKLYGYDGTVWNAAW